MDLIFRNGSIISDGLQFNGDLGVKDGVVKAIGDLTGLTGKEEVDCKGKTLLPGCVDLGLNLYEGGESDPPSEMTLQQSSFEALNGGVTTLISTLPLSKPEVDVKEYIKECADTSALLTDFGYHLLIEEWSELLPSICRDAIAAGVPSMWIPRKGLSSPSPSPSLIYQLLEFLPKDCLLITSPFEAIMGEALKKSYTSTGKKDEESWRMLCPERMGSSFIDAMGRVVAASRARVLIHGVPDSESLKALLEKRQLTGRLYGSATIPQLTFQEGQAQPHTWPPVPTKTNQQAIYAALEDGLLSIISSDHKPRHPKESYSLGDEGALPTVGTATLSAFLPALHTEGVSKWRLSLPMLTLCAAADPAKLAGIYPRKGSLQLGSDADVVIFDPEKESQKSAPEADATAKVDFLDPLAHSKLLGNVESVYIRGKLKLQEGRIAGNADGKFLSRKLSLK